MELSLAIISDLHCHHSSQQPAESLLLSDLDRLPAAQHPVEALLDRIKTSDLHADFVVAPGDLANKVDRQGMISGWQFVHEIARALGARAVVATIGNHDVLSREKTAPDPFQLPKRLKPEFPSSDPRLTEQFWANGFFIWEADGIRFLVVNSAASHHNEILAKRGLITEAQLDKIRRGLEETNGQLSIAVCHHHPMLHEDIGLRTDDVIQNGSLFTQLLSEHKFDFLIHGHKHHPKLSYAPHGPNPLPVLAAGSFSAAMSSGLASRTRNLFHIVKLLRAKGADPSQGTIETFQFRHSKGWSPATWVAAEFPEITGFGCAHGAPAIAEMIRSAFDKLGKPVANWAEITAMIPELRFVPPVTFEATGIALKKMGFVLAPLPPDEPRFIGRA
jgi:predicted phosphodiesterase